MARDRSKRSSSPAGHDPALFYELDPSHVKSVYFCCGSRFGFRRRTGPDRRHERSNARAEFASLFRTTRQSAVDHERSKIELKALEAAVWRQVRQTIFTPEGAQRPSLANARSLAADILRAV